MENSNEPQHDDSAPETVPKRTTPTWEMELLLSGATVFALFQAAQAMLAASMYIIPRLDGGMRLLVAILLTYAHGAVLLLVLGFALHLILRAYWVALVGMNSVFPDGLRLDRISAGPVTKALLSMRWQSLDAGIERADNRATIVFGLGISMALALVPVSLSMAVMFLVSWGIAWAFGNPDAVTWILLVVATIWFTPLMLAAMIDKVRGDKLVPGTAAHRACLSVLAFYVRMGMGRDANPLLTLYGSNVGEKKATWVAMGVVFGALMLSFVGVLLSRNDLGMGDYGLFPDNRRGMPSSAEGRNYASSQERGLSPQVPFVPDMVAKGDYLKLVVPYVPTLHSHLLKACDVPAGEEEKVAAESARRRQLLACFSEGLEVTLDGRPVGFAPEWYTEPQRDLRGLLFMIPVQDLAPGRHVMGVLPAAEAPTEDGEDPPQPFLIPFWR